MAKEKGSRNPMARILNSPDKGLNRVFKAEGVLAKLWCQILADLDMSPQQWGTLMADFITDVRNGRPSANIDPTSIRGNLLKEFSRTWMTWKVFLKALRFLQFRRFSLIIEAEHRDGRVTRHSVPVRFGYRTDPNPLLEELSAGGEEENGEQQRGEDPQVPKD